MCAISVIRAVRRHARKTYTAKWVPVQPRLSATDRNSRRYRVRAVTTLLALYSPECRILAGDPGR